MYLQSVRDVEMASKMAGQKFLDRESIQDL